MKVSELYERYIEMLESSGKDFIDEDDIYSWINKQINMFYLSSAAMLEVIRSVNKNATKKVGQYKYIDRSAQMIGLEISMISLFTDLEFDDITDGRMTDSIMSDYDLSKRMRLVEFLRKYHRTAVSHFDDLCDRENNTFEQENSISAVISYSLDSFTEKVNMLIDTLIDQIENFDPSKIQEAKNLLENMNNSISAINDLNK